MKKIFAIFTLALFALFIYGCDRGGGNTPGGDTPGGDTPGGETPEKPVISINETELSLTVGDTYTFTVDIDILMESSSRSVVTVNESTKTITAVGAGTSTVTIYALEDTTVSKTITVTVVSNNQSGNEDPGNNDLIIPTDIEIICDKTEIYLDETLQLSIKVTPEDADTEVTWVTGQKTYIDLSEDGLVTPIRGGTAKIKVSSAHDSSINTTIEIKILNTIDPDKFFGDIAFENPVTQTIKVFGWADNSSYEYDLLGQVTKYFFGDINITVDYSPLAKVTEKTDPDTGEKYDDYSNGRTGEKLHGYRYIVIHDTAETRTNGTAISLGNWVETQTSSWHFAVDDKNVVQKIPYDEVSWNAGDGAIAEDVTFKNTYIKATSDEPAKVTISSDGYFMLNGQKSTIRAPRKTVDGNEVSGKAGIPTNENIPYTGIENYVDPTTGTYWIGNTWWSETYEHVGNYGGSTHAIAIEGCITKGSNISLAWSNYAKLVGKYIMDETGMDPSNLRQHNSFSGKDCPMTMRHARFWETFVEMVTAEYLMQKYFKDYTVEFICDSPYITSTGLIKSLPSSDTKVSYQIKVSGKDFTKTYNYSFTLPSKTTRNVNEKAPLYQA